MLSLQYLIFKIVKRISFRLIITFVFFVVALAVAFPTIYFSYGDSFYRIRGLNPSDFNENFLIPEFVFRPSLDFQNGEITTFNADLSVLPKADRQPTLERTKNIVFTRFLRAGLSDFELSSQVDHENEIYQLVLKSAEKIDPIFLSLLTVPGEVSVWIVDPSVDLSTATEEDQQNPLFGRMKTGISNDDFESVSVISDSRIYLYSEEEPNNFGVKVVYKEESALKFVTAFQQSTTAPMLYLIDSSLVAFQTPAQQYNTLSPGRESLLTTLGQDSYKFNSVIASVMGTPRLNFQVNITNSQIVSANFPNVSLASIQIISVLAFVFVVLLLSVFYKQKSIFIFVIGTIFSVWTIALLKVFNATLSLSTFVGFILSLVIFLQTILSIMYVLKAKSIEKIEPKLLTEVFEKYSKQYRNILIATVILILFIQFSFSGFVAINNLLNGLGFGLITGMIVMIIGVKSLLPIFYLSKNKK